MNLPLGKECHQPWLDMKSVEGGRMCGSCQKKIFDMSRMSWTEIEELQRKNNYGACGMYSDKQIRYWGKEIPKKNNFFSAKMILASLLFYFSNTPVESACETKAETHIQIPPEKSENRPATIVSDTLKRTTVSGKIITRDMSNQEVTGGTVIMQLNNTIIDTSILSGNYFDIDITSYIIPGTPYVLGFTCKGYLFTMYNVEPEQIGTNIKLYLELQPVKPTYYIVRKPTISQRLFHRKLFRKINK